MPQTSGLGRARHTALACSGFHSGSAREPASAVPPEAVAAHAGRACREALALPRAVTKRAWSRYAQAEPARPSDKAPGVTSSSGQQGDLAHRATATSCLSRALIILHAP